MFKTENTKPLRPKNIGLGPIPPPPTKEIIDLELLVDQLKEWINNGNSEQITKSWDSISEYCANASNKITLKS